jgi:hypothetical protein
VTVVLAGGVGRPALDDVGTAWFLPVTCQACGSPVHIIGHGPGTKGIVTRVAMECSNPKCPGLWVITISMRGMKRHELDNVGVEREHRRRHEVATGEPNRERH